MADQKTIGDYRVSKSLLGRKFVLTCKCPICDTSLKIAEDQLKPVDICPNCGESFGVPARAIDRIQRLASQRDAESDRLAAEAEERRQLKEEQRKQRDESADKCSVCGKKGTLFHTLIKQGDGTFRCKEHIVTVTPNDVAMSADVRLPPQVIQKKPPGTRNRFTSSPKNMRSYWVLELYSSILNVSGAVCGFFGFLFVVAGASAQSQPELMTGVFAIAAAVPSIVAGSFIKLAVNVAGDIERISHVQESLIDGDDDF